MPRRASQKPQAASASPEAASFMRLLLELRFMVFAHLSGEELTRLRNTNRQLRIEVDDELCRNRVIGIDYDTWVQRIKKPYIQAELGPMIQMRSTEISRYLQQDCFVRPQMPKSRKLKETCGLPCGCIIARVKLLPKLPADLSFMNGIHSLAVAGSVVHDWCDLQSAADQRLTNWKETDEGFEQWLLGKLSQMVENVFPSLRTLYVCCDSWVFRHFFSSKRWRHVYKSDVQVFRLQENRKWDHVDYKLDEIPLGGLASLPGLDGPLGRVHEWNQLERLSGWYERHFVERSHAVLANKAKLVAKGKPKSMVSVERDLALIILRKSVLFERAARCRMHLKRETRANRQAEFLARLQKQIETTCFVPQKRRWANNSKQGDIVNFSTAEELLTMVRNGDLGVKTSRKPKYAWCETEKKWKLIPQKKRKLSEVN